MSESERIPDVTLERFRLGELPEADLERVRLRLASDQALRERLLALERSDAQILADLPPRVVAAAVASRAGDRVAAPGRAVRRLAPAAASIAAVVGVLLYSQLPSRPAPGFRGEGAPGDRLKGNDSLALVVFRKSGGPAERLVSGTRATRGDVIQLAYRAGGQRYGVLLSVDGRGAVTRHLPPRGGEPEQLRASGLVALDAAYQLDDAPRFERFYLVGKDAPFDVGAVLAAARQPGVDAASLERLPLDASFAQATFLLKKE